MKRRVVVFFAVILALALSYWLFSGATPSRTVRAPEDGWTGQYTGNISNNMNLTTMQIESDGRLAEVHAGAVRHVQSQFPELEFAPNRPYFFNRSGDGYSLGYRTRKGAPKHNYVIVDYISESDEYRVLPTL